MKKELIFKNLSDNSRAAAEIISRCREEHITKLTLEKGEYHFYSETADEDIYCLSNHGENGFRRIAFLIKDMENFELDGNGSLLVFHGAMTPVVIRNSKNIKVSNLSIRFMQTLDAEFAVVNYGEDFVDLKACGENQYHYCWKHLYLHNEQGIQDLVFTAEEFDGKYPAPEVGEQCFGADFLTLKHEEIEPGVVRVFNPPHIPRKSIILVAAKRYGSGCAILDSEDVYFDNVCVYSCYGIAFHAQVTNNITLNRCKTTPYPGTSFSANADATHFVSCTGKLVIKDCLFESQLDDAINIHGIYTSVYQKEGNTLYVRFVNLDTQGLYAFKEGCHINIIDKDTMIPKVSDLTVTSCEMINRMCIKLTVEGDVSNICVGDVCDSVDFYPEVLIENNTFNPNRARTILIGSSKPVVIRNNYFCSTGTAIKLECDCGFWYESGAVNDLLIENNVFDNCRYIDSECWGSHVIQVQPRDKVEEGKYFHGKLVFRNNDFTTSNKKVFDVGYADEIIIENNKLPSDAEIKIIYCGVQKINN